MGQTAVAEAKKTAAAMTCGGASLSGLLDRMGEIRPASEESHLRELRCYPEAELRRALEAVIAGPVRATRKEFAVYLFKLFNHYWCPEFKPDQWSSVVADFANDMAECTRDELIEACDLWRRDEENRFRPTPGGLLGNIKWRLDVRQRERRGAERALRILSSHGSSDGDAPVKDARALLAGLAHKLSTRA